MTTSSANRWVAGETLPEMAIEPITRTTLALFAGASGDHNPVHIDLDVARAAGFPDVFAHGMLVMAYLGRAVTHWVPQLQLRSYWVRFIKITEVGDSLRCQSRISTVENEGDGRKRIELELLVSNAANEIKLTGTASYILQPI